MHPARWYSEKKEALADGKKVEQLTAVVVHAGEALFNPGLNDLKQAGIFQVGAGFVVGEIPALPGPGFMDGATLAHAIIRQEEAGAIRPGFEGVFILQETSADLAIADAEMPGQAVDVCSVEEKRGTGKPVTAISGAVVAVGLVAGQDVACTCICHQRKFLDSMS